MITNQVGDKGHLLHVEFFSTERPTKGLINRPTNCQTDGRELKITFIMLCRVVIYHELMKNSSSYINSQNVRVYVCMYVCHKNQINQKIKELFDYLINKSSWILFQFAFLIQEKNF